MAATLRLVFNAFEPEGNTTVVECNVGETVREALRREQPDWLLREVVVFIDANAANMDDTIGPDCAVSVVLVPEYAPAFWAYVGKVLLQAFIVAAVSYAINAIFFPKRKDGRNASPAYSITIDQNAPRIGEVIPVIYGRVRALPDIAAQPYTQYVGNSQQQVCMILCLGMGEYDVNQIYVGGTRISDFPAGSIQTWIFPPSSHGQVLGNIEATTGIVEDMNTVLESTQVDLNAPNDSAEITLPGNTSGGYFDPESPDAGLWAGLVVGRQYIITNTAGTSVTATYLGIDPNNRAQFDQPLPPALATGTISFFTALSYITNNVSGTTAILVPPSGQPIPPGFWSTIQVGEIISFVRNDTNQFYGPMQYMGPLAGAGYPQFALSGNGFVATMPTQTFPQTTNITITRAVVNNYTIKEVSPETTPDGFRWRGWFAMTPPGTTSQFLYVDIVFPGGITWITDKGDYRVTTVTLRVEYQQIDDDSNPFGPVLTQNFSFSNSTNNPQRFSRQINVVNGRWRLRIARTSNRDQRPSKESSVAILDSVRAKIYHPPGTPAYEACTLIAMKFTASSGLAAAQNRRIQVDCTRRLPIQGSGTNTVTNNPADAVIDVYTNTYGAAAPLADIDLPTLARLRTQWGTTGGFNAVFDQPSTVMEAMQQVLTPVRAMVLPVGNQISFVQECPRPREYVFGPGVVVQDTLQIGYAWDSESDTDCVAVTYQNFQTWQDASVFYPAQNVRPDRFDLFGVTSSTHAASWARLTWQERLYARKKVRFRLEGDGYLLTPFSRFALAVPTIDMGQGGRVIAYNPTTKVLELDAEFPRTTPGFQPKLILTYYDTGGASGPIDVQPLPYASRFVTVTGTLPYNPIPSDSLVGDGTGWFATQTQNVLMEFRVTDVQPVGEFQVEVTGIQYNPAVYTGTFLETWTP